MKGNLPYFYIKENLENMRGIRIYTSENIPSNIDTLNERFYEMTREFVLEIEKTKEFIFPDLMMNVYPLISERFREVLLLFDIEIFVKRVVLIDKESREIQSYYLLYTENLLNTDFNNFFRVVREENENIGFIVNLDFAESLIRRGFKGIEFVEVEESV
ncbi:hypothetical protein [Lachnoanaerobaculum gingivalis]|uniref:hypothetical protein n=1 Tax=Lachnoanaerobaculum gingivalis TaxID=2490855 RepID=UPI0024A76348|nr:hypothetical protein [Lachnoanaerobaculum gingivalis]WHE86777.1 hypothetical protein QJR73_10895 [Lachnoanaerobaculum gingivalis]